MKVLNQILDFVKKNAVVWLYAIVAYTVILFGLAIVGGLYKIPLLGVAAAWASWPLQAAFGLLILMIARDILQFFRKKPEQKISPSDNLPGGGNGLKNPPA